MAFRRQPLTVLFFALAIFLLASILPICCMLAQFITDLLRQPKVITNALIDIRQLILLGRSLMIASCATAVALAIGLPVAIILAAKDLPFRKFFYFLVLVPVLIPSYVMAGAWIHLLSPSGFVNTTLSAAFGPSAKLILHTTAGCAWCLGISFFPIIAVIVAAGLSEIDGSLVDIARLSTNCLKVFWHSILPQILPHVVASVCLVIIFVLAQYGVPSLLGINTYPVEIFAQFSAFYDDSAAVATALPLAVVVIFLILLQRRLMRNHNYVRITPSSDTDNSITLNRIKPYAIGFLIALFVITTVLPFSSVFIYAQGLARIYSTLRSFSDSILTTSILALLSAIVCTVIAFPIGQHLAQSRSRFTKALDIICWLPIAIGGTIIGLGLIKLANGAAILRNNDNIGIGLGLAYIGMFSAFSIRIFEASHKRTDPNVAEVAALDCPRWYLRLFYIDIPMHLPAIVASLIVVFVLVLGELNATVLLIPPGKATLGISIDNLLHYGANATASGLCLIEAGVVILSIVFGSFLLAVYKKSFKGNVSNI